MEISYLEVNHEDEMDRFTYGAIPQYAYQEYDLEMNYTYGDTVNFSAIYSDVNGKDDSFSKS